MKLAIMQPCYLPWRGYFALMRLADVFIFLDDVPLPQGRTLQTRIALKTITGRQWLTVPVHHHANQLIRDVQIANSSWRIKHLRTLRQQFGRHADIVGDLYGREWTHLADLNIALINRMADAFGIFRSASLLRSSDFSADGAGWQKILNLCTMTGATTYITGHGARHYFDHETFEAADIEVCYLDYNLSPYPQPHGPFDPYVTALDVLAHASDPAACINADLVPWRKFLNDAPSYPVAESIRSH